MPIVRNRYVQNALADLDRFYQELRAAVSGDDPNPNEAHQYHCDPAAFVGDHRDIDPARIKRALALFKLVADAMNDLPKQAEQRVFRP